MQLHMFQRKKTPKKTSKKPNNLLSLVRIMLPQQLALPIKKVTDFAVNRWTELTQLSYSVSHVLFQVVQHAAELCLPWICVSGPSFHEDYQFSIKWVSLRTTAFVGYQCPWLFCQFCFKLANRFKRFQVRMNFLWCVT